MRLVRRAAKRMQAGFYLVRDTCDYMQRGHSFSCAVDLARKVIH